MKCKIRKGTNERSVKLGKEQMKCKMRKGMNEV